MRLQIFMPSSESRGISRLVLSPGPRWSVLVILARELQGSCSIFIIECGVLSENSGSIYSSCILNISEGSLSYPFFRNESISNNSNPFPLNDMYDLVTR